MKRLLIIFFIALSHFTFPLYANAVPAWPGWQRLVLPDSTIVECRLVGDEHGHAFIDRQGRLFTLDNQQTLRPLAALPRSIPHHAISADANGRTSFPTHGDIRGLVLLVEFSDNSFYEDHTPGLFDEMMNGEDYTYGGATGSASRYFRDQSSNEFRPQFDVVGPVKLTRNVNFYGQNIGQNEDAYAQEMVAEACLQADTLYNVDFTQYDNDGDGVVDFVYVFYAGYGESYGAPSYTIWPHQGQLSQFGLNCQVDGLTIDRYACSCELKYTSGHTIEGIGTFCHEFGHVLGLPDLYQTNGGNDHFLASWDIMDIGCYNNDSHTPPSYSAFERYCMRWLEYTDIDRPATGLPLQHIAASNQAYRLTSANEGEYFLLENRQSTGWDAHTGGHGLLITHIDYEGYAWQGNRVNNDASHPRVTIVAADGTRSITPEGDAFPGTTGKTAFTDYTNPASTLWDGTPLGKSVSSIREDENGTITFSLMQDKLATPALLEPKDVTDTSFVASWTAVENSPSYTLFLRPLLADSVLPVPVSEDFGKLAEGSPTTKNNPEITALLDSLTQQPGWTGEELYAAGGHIQVGRTGASGRLTTPIVQLAQADTAITIAFASRAFANRTVNCDLLVHYTRSGELLDSVRWKATATTDTIVYSLLCPHPSEGVGGPSLTVTLTTNRERLFVDELRILRGHRDASTAFAVSNPMECITGIGESEYLCTGLIPATTYQYWVQAVCGDPLYDSEPSAVGTVTLASSQPSSIAIQTSGYGSDILSLYNISGQLLYHGPASSMPALLPGKIYIVRQGFSVRKVVI